VVTSNEPLDAFERLAAMLAAQCRPHVQRLTSFSCWSEQRQQRRDQHNRFMDGIW
jgi:hypothetical protein